MKLTINVGKNVAEKIKLISKLGGLNSTELDTTLSNAVDKHLSIHLIRLTKEMLSSVGVHEEDLTSGVSSSGIDTMMGQMIKPEQEEYSYETTEELGGSLDTFDDINRTSEKTALAKKPDIPTLEDSSIDSIQEEMEDFIQGALEEEEEDYFKAENNSWQGSLMEETDSDLEYEELEKEDSPIGGVEHASYSEASTADTSMDTPDVLPIDLGIDRVSSEGGDMQGSVDFMAALLKGSLGDPSLRNNNARF